MSANKKINFGAGPAKIPEEVLYKIQRELLNYDDRTGISILEMSHRSADFSNLVSETEKLLRESMKIPDDYSVLFMHGGGTGQFAAIPQNLGFLAKNVENPSANYLVTGSWSDKAAKEGEKFIHVNKIQPKRYTGIPNLNYINEGLDPDAAYLYYCANETIHGIEFYEPPKVDQKNLVADISSNILSRPFDVSKHALAFAGTQKNLGAAGLTLVVVKKSLLGHTNPYTPSILSYHEIHNNKSLYNTPPCFSIYVTKLVLEWIRDQGGPEVIFERNAQKSSALYNEIDTSNGFYNSVIEKNCRSQMNIPFRIGNNDETLESEFLKQAANKHMIYLKGHRSVGGIRASLYNAVTIKETYELIDLMREFKEASEGNN